MKKVAILVVVMVSSLTLLSLVGLVGANPHPYPGDPGVNVNYSTDQLSNTVTLQVNISTLQDTDYCIRQAWYSLDGQKNVSIPLTCKGTSYWGIYNFSDVTGETKMPMWSSDPHTLNVTVSYNYGSFITAASKTLYIGQPEPTPTPPVLSIISPQNQATYNTNEIQIIYNLNLNVDWSYYALDTPGQPEGSDWKSFNGNITLSGLTEGSHKIIISVKAETAYIPSWTDKTIDFKIDSSIKPSSTQSTPTPTVPEFSSQALLILIALMAIAMISIIIKKTSNIPNTLNV